MWRRSTIITQPPNDEYDDKYSLERINQLVTEKGNPELLHLYRMDLGAEGMMHLKIMIADDDLVLVGSANLTKRAMEKNIEAGILVYGHSASIFSKVVRALIELNKNKKLRDSDS